MKRGGKTMFLKQIDVVGFKSFAKRMNIEFVPGVTAVVGPNGSGKSNITDAIRWVLGEQSAKSLRGVKMEDIIFDGSDTKKPLNVAEVTLILDNQDEYLALDYNEISVTRRIYRSGESEYLLNNQQCRLKDIVDLFMDSGLGREAYSVIGQGKIDEILNSKAEDKRKIFEEAAGVLKYKTRKLKAEKKLDETQDNLNRIDDILHELEGQVEPLKMQASIAKDYLQKKEELEQTEVALIVHEIEDYHAKWTELSNAVEKLQEEEIRLSTKITEEEAAMERMRADLQSLDDSTDELQEVLLVASEELEKLEGQKKVLKERKKNAKQNRELLKQHIKSYQDKKAKHEENIKIKQDIYGEEKQKLANLKNELTKKEKALESIGQNIEDELERFKSDYIETLNEQATVKNEIRYLKEQRSQLEAKSGRLYQNHKKYNKKRTEIEQRKSEQTKQWETEKERLESCKKAFNDVKDKLQTETGAAQKKQSQLQQAYRLVQQVRSRKELLQEMEEDFTGFFQGVKEVLKAGNKLKGIEGAVAQLITVPKQYETAVETALGAAMQHIVVEREEHARQAIQYLKKNKNGRATLLPLSVIKPRTISARVRDLITTHLSFAGVAAELVSCQNEYTNVIANLLGHVVIAKDLRGANEIARMLGHRHRIVTIEGDVVNPGGSMSGGTRKNQHQTLLGRQRELESITAKLEDVEKKTVDLEKEAQHIQDEIRENEMRLERLREEGENIRLNEQKCQSELREIQLEEKNLNEHLTLYDRQQSGFNDEKASVAERIGKLELKLEEVSAKETQLDKNISALTEKKQEQQQSKEHTQSAITDLKVNVAGEAEHVSNLKNSIDALIESSQENCRLLDETQQELSLLEGEMNNDFSGEEQLEEKIDKKRSDKDASVDSIRRRRQERFTQQKELEDRQRELKELKRAEKQHGETLRGEEVKHNRLDVELENRLKLLREDYELSFEAAKEQYKLFVEADQARKQVKLIKRSIEELGSVNLGAIEEYERVATRHQFLTEQREDLQYAKQNLLHVIAEMDDEVVKRFEETFSGVREQFQYIFKELFGGGRADLKLSEPDNLLNTGVEIVAQPPGKKLQNLSLLSGGERAFTAIALLFSILKIRPVPFCVLDEVEAALDEANVTRFANYLKTFSKQTQFVVVTHRKGTMEKSDVLYGVTMQESGVSKLVSVRLEESKQLVEA
jgi:chromosome segregation protein